MANSVAYGTITISDLSDGAQIWTTTAAPNTPDYTFTISNLSGDGNADVKIGDLIFYDIYRYTVTSVGSTTVLGSYRTTMRGNGILRVTSAPSVYTTTTSTGYKPSYRMALGDVLSQSGATAVLVGDTIEYDTYHYPVGYVTASFVYMGDRIDLTGPTGATGATGATGESGDDGYNQATIYLYRRSATTISTKPGAATYTFSTGSLTSVSNWTRTIPADDGTPCYVSSVSVKSRTNTASIAQADWSSPILLITSSTKWYSGTAITGTSSTAAVYSTGITYANVGDHYINTSTQNVYRCTVAGNVSTAKWVYEQNIKGPQGVTGINGTSSYFHVKYSNDGGSTFTGNSGEDPGDYIGTYTDDNATDSTSVSSYTWVRVTGLNQATIYLYKRSATAVSTKPVGATYTFSTGALTSVSGWSRSIPASDGNPCYVSSISVSSTASSVTINQNDWSTPIKLVEDGAKGETGATGATGATGEDGNGIVSKTDYYMLSDTMDLSELNTSKSYYKKAMSGKPVTVSDATSIASFDDIVVDVNYIQSGSGDPYLPGSTKNKFNPNTRTTGKYINESGVISSDTNSSYSELIPVTVGTTYTYSGKSSSSGSNNKRVHGYASGVWQQQIAFESIAASTNFAITFTVPTGVDAIRISAYTADTNIQLEEGSTATSYVAYSNIRPITGWTSANVYRTGKNLIGGLDFANTIKWALPAATIDEEGKTVAFSSSTTASHHILDNNTNFCFKPSARYVIILKCNKSSGTSANLRWHYTDGNVTNIAGVDTVGTIATKMTRSVSGKTVDYLYKYASSGTTTLYYDECGIFEDPNGNMPLSSFEPYNGVIQNIPFPTEAGTVYGGHIDLKAGTLTVTHGIKTFNGQESWGKSTADNPNGTTYTLADSNVPFKTWHSDAGGAICSHFKRSSVDGLANGDGFYWYKASSGGWRFVYGATGGTDTVDNFKNFLQTQYTNGTPVTICAELETPIVYNIQTPDISQLAGTNNIWANTGDISLSYYNEENPTWKTESLEPNPYGKYLWWYYNTTYTDGTSVDSDPAVIGIYNQDWYDETQKAIADAESASQTANDAAKAAEANAGALRNISDIVNGTENTTGLVDQINSISNTMATASSVEELREEKNQDLERLISNYSLSDFLNWFHFDQNQGLIIGKTTTTGSANYVLRLEGDIISFYELTGNVSDLNDQQRVGYFQNRNLMSENIVALSTFDLGNFRFMKQDSGNLSFVYTG